MRKILRCFTIAPLLIGLGSIVGMARPVALQGVITQVVGAVQAVGPGVREVPLAHPFQVILAGVTVRVPKDGAAGIVCSNLRFVRLHGPASWSLTEPACAAGKELTPAEYALIAPQGGRFRVVEGLLMLEREIRGGHGDDPLAPVVLSPRNTTLRSPRPTVSWSRVPSATSYRVQWRGRGAGDDIELRAGDVACPEDLAGMAFCSLPWPEDRSGLAPGETFFLQVAAQSGIRATWRLNDPVEVRTQGIAAASGLEQQLRDLAGLGLEGPALEVARAGLLAEKGLYADAAGLYRQALAVMPSPELRVTLADLYFSMGLYFLAEPLYREALTSNAPAVRAAAAFGLGRIAYSLGNFQDAAASFRQARELYSQLRLGEEKGAARKAAETAAARIPPPPSKNPPR
jgi:hypothetical protein